MTNETHEHEHGPGCGHTAIRHDDHIDHLHDGELHHHDAGSVERHALPVSEANPGDCTPDHDCAEHDAHHQHGPDCGHETVPHGDHVDYLVGGHLHHPHGDHCDDHGAVEVIQRG
jgi:hypothetical protein